MLALYFDGKLELQELPRPEPGPLEVLIQVHLAGVCRTDLEVLRGYHGFRGVPGHEFLGTVAGPQDSFRETCTALQNGKQITEATLYLEKQEHVWRVTFKGETFSFASFKCPAVKPERDSLTDESNEWEAVFYERMHVLEEGLQLFDSLYNDFLNERLSQDWERRTRAIREWLI